MDKQYFSCECETEGILLSKFIDDLEENDIYLSIFRIGQFTLKPTILNRLKYCWYHLTTGKKHEDQVILSFENAQKIGEWLINNSKNNEQKS